MGEKMCIRQRGFPTFEIYALDLDGVEPFSEGILVDENLSL